MNYQFNALSIFKVCLATVFIFSATLTNAGENTKKSFTNNFSLEQLRLFSEVYNKIRQSYVDKIDNKELFKNAIKGMVNGLDPHSTFMEAKSYDNLKINTVGKFGGLGITVSMENGFVKVISPIDDTPAYKAGIKAGDLIFLINGTRVKGLTLDEAVNIMRGKPGTSIKITVVREGESKPLEFKITRELIKLTSVKSHLIGKDIGYLRISQFTLNTFSEAKKALDELNKSVKKGNIAGIILDLRNNPGGALKGAIDISSLFLDGGVVVSTKSRNKYLNQSFKASKGDILKGKPIVVMINNGSASASEIVSGALQDRKRATIIGTRSFGKASVQSIIPLSGGTALKLTTARYYTPSGKSIQSNGIIPDIFIPNAKLTIKEKDFQLREKNLNRHLIGDNEKKNKENSKKSTDNQNNKTKEKGASKNNKKSKEKLPATEAQKNNDSSEAKKSLTKSKNKKGIVVNADKKIKDYTLYEATNILRSLILFSNNNKKN